MQTLTRQKIPVVRPVLAVRQAMKGFTLPEMLIVVAIMTIMMSIAIPSFNSTIRDNRVSSATNSIAAAIAQARSEAVKRGRMVSVCPSISPYTACSANSADWRNGWIVYLEDINVTTGGAPTPDTTDAVNLPGGIISTGATLTNVAVAKSAGSANAYIRFSPRGLSEEALTLQIRPADSSGSTSVACAPGKANFLQLQMGVVGRTSVTKLPC